MDISLKQALVENSVGEKKGTRKVLLNLNDENYSKVCQLLKENGLTFNAFISNFLVLLLEDKVKIQDSDLKELTR